MAGMFLPVLCRIMHSLAWLFAGFSSNSQLFPGHQEVPLVAKPGHSLGAYGGGRFQRPAAISL